MRTATAMGILAAALALGVLSSCASPVEGAWEGRWELAQGNDPAGYEVHLTLTRFMTDEPGGAVEYTIFRPDGRRDLCSAALHCESKADGTFQYRESITQGKCDDGRTVRVSTAGEEALDFQRLDSGGVADIAGKLSVQTGIATAKGTL